MKELSDVIANRNGNKWSFGVTLERTGGAPLDKWSWWPSVAEASAYAKGMSDPALSIPDIAYPGQILTVAETSGVAAYLVTNTYDLMKLAAGGSTDELNTLLQKEIAERAAADTYISSQVSALPDAISKAKTEAAVTVEALSAAQDGFLKTYVVKQNGVAVGDAINIPKDFLVKSASVKTCSAANDPETGYAVGDKYIDFVINSKDNDVADSHMYVKVTDLVDTYVGCDGTTVATKITDGNEISAEVKDGAIDAAKLATAVSAEISAATAGIAANTAAIAAAKSELEDYADQAEADALAAAKTDAAAKIASLTASVSAGSDDGKQKFFTKITQSGGVVAAEANVIQVGDVNGLNAQLQDIAGNVQTTVDTAINALDVTDVAVAKKFVTAVSQTDGKISVARADIGLDDLSGDLKAQLTAKLDGVYDLSGAATTAEANAKTAADTALTAAKAELTGLVSTTSADTLDAAKTHAESVGAALRTDVDEISGNLAAAVEDIAAAEADIESVSTDVGTLSTAAKTLRTDVDSVSSALTAEVSRAEAAETANANSLTALRSEVAAVSADHETRIADAEADITSLSGAVDLLSSAMRFRGVLLSSDINADETIQAALTRKFSEPIDGDVVVYTTNGTEYVYVASAWHELGNENNHATKSQLEIETTARTDADAAISAAVDQKIYIDGVSAATLSVKNISRDDYHQLVLDGAALSNCVYVVSADTLNMYGEKIENLLSGSADGDAVNVAQLNAAKTALEASIADSKISAATFNGQAATVADNAIAFDISCIDCGDASS